MRTLTAKTLFCTYLSFSSSVWAAIHDVPAVSLHKRKATNPACRNYEMPNLLDTTIDHLNLGLECGAFTSLDLTTAYIFRMKEVSFRGVKLDAVIQENPEARSIARQMDRLRAAGKIKGPLHGIPVLLKDNIGTKSDMDMETTAGSWALFGCVRSTRFGRFLEQKRLNPTTSISSKGPSSPMKHIW